MVPAGEVPGIVVGNRIPEEAPSKAQVFFIFSFFFLTQYRFFFNIEGPEGLTTVLEAAGIHFHQDWSKSDRLVPDYDTRTELLGVSFLKRAPKKGE